MRNLEIDSQLYGNVHRTEVVLKSVERPANKLCWKNGLSI